MVLTTDCEDNNLKFCEGFVREMGIPDNLYAIKDDKKIDEKLNNIIAELKTIESIKINTKQDDFDSVLIQIERNNISTKMHADETRPEEFENLSRCLNNLPVIFTNSEVQDIIDLFDFDECVNVSQKLGWTYRDELITKKILVENAIELLKNAIDCNRDCGRFQLGRLVVNFFTSPDEGRWYTMTFFVEHGEEC